MTVDDHGRQLAHVADLDDPMYSDDVDPITWDQFEPNVVSSLTATGTHRPILDLDFPCRLIPSSTPGRFHLYLDGIELGTEVFANVLGALADAGVVQKPWARRMDTHGAVFLRLPHVRKAVKS